MTTSLAADSTCVAHSEVVRRRLRVTGVVQGVGFRPFVHRLATELELAGFVGNDGAGVFIEVEGPGPSLERFAERLVEGAPPLARIDEVTGAEIDVVGDAASDQRFSIVASAAADGARTLIPPDVAVCAECLAEVDDPDDRRYRYPFTNCTNCGPRFTIIRNLPYDRPQTTMAAFEMCPACAAEYSDPRDRRYHAQPVACPSCGPQLAFNRTGEPPTIGTDPVVSAVQASIAAGEIVAVKGLGGYHLACDAADDVAIATLRERKGRVDKPFAVMVADLDAARRLVELESAEEEALTSAAAPIVLARRRAGAPLSGLVAPGNPLLGVMLAYTPLHHLLFAAVPGNDRPPPAVLVMTSGNRSNEPICFDDADARHRLGDLADAFCVHDRPIDVPCDDSVVRVIDGEVQPIRRSRGYAPVPVALPVDVTPTLAVGGELKNTFCLAAGRQAWVGQHIGDMENLETLTAFDRSVDNFERMYEVSPRNVAADLHPQYLTRRWAVERADRTAATLIDVQHHHAHLAAVMAEHGLPAGAEVIGVAFDGTGYGTDDRGAAQIWGGEVLLAGYDGYRRVGHLRPMPLPGGDTAVRNPCRIAIAYLSAAELPLDPRIAAVAACDDVERDVVTRQVERDVGCVPTTSAGRLFDAVASLLGVRHRITYEAQAAIELEALAARGDPAPLALPVDDGIFDVHALLTQLVDALAAETPPADLAAGFHAAVADAIVVSARRARDAGAARTVALSGGVFQNSLLTCWTRRRLEAAGFDVLTHRLVPPNDGGLSLGQAVIAGRRSRRDPERN